MCEEVDIFFSHFIEFAGYFEEMDKRHIYEETELFILFSVFFFFFFFFFFFNQSLMVTLKNLTLTIEEALLFKIFLMAGYDQSDSELEKVEEHQYDMRRMLAAATSVNATRYDIL